MKNRSSAILILVTFVFAAFTLGFFLGRATAPSPVILSPLKPQAAAISAAAENINPTESAATIPSNPAQETTPATEPASGLININTATAQELDTLPGIGPVLAQRIIDYRQAHGPFVSPGQLMQVNGIGEKKLEQILELITTE